MHVVIVGGGVVGASTAYFLAKRGAEVTLVERGTFGREASAAAGGILGAQSEQHGGMSTEQRRRLVQARGLYSAWAKELGAVSGIDVSYIKSGSFHLAFDERELAELRTELKVQEDLGFKVTWCDAQGFRDIEPEVSSEALGALHFPDDAQLEPQKLMLALREALRLLRCTVREHEQVHDVVVEKNRAIGVHCEDGPILGDRVVVAAGAWASKLPALSHDVAPHVRPIRGQMVLLRQVPPMLRSILFGGGGYVLPRPDGRVILGSTSEDIGFVKVCTVQGIQEVLARGARVVPALREAEFVEAWCGLRPRIEDGLPRIGPTRVPGLYVAVGHYRNGILLACQTGRDLAEELLAGAGS
jgi:glycine oxidase